jgi:hypothetical protein
MNHSSRRARHHFLRECVSSFFLLALASLLLHGCGSSERPLDNHARDGRVAVHPIHPSADDGPVPKDVSTSPIKFSPAPYPTVYRFAKISTGAYFYTGSDIEAATIVKDYPDFRFEGHAFSKELAAGATPVFRFANLNNGGYFYTGSTEERDIIIANMPHLRFEGSTFAVAATTLAYSDPVYRLANLNNGAYLYTQSATERDYAVSLGMWRSEGTTFSAEAAIPNGDSVIPKNFLYTAKDGTQILSNLYDTVAGWFFPYATQKRFALLRTEKPIATAPFTPSYSLGNQGCARPLSRFNIELDNTITYSATDVSADDHIEAAVNIEKGVVDQKGRQGIASATLGYSGTKVVLCVQNEEPAGIPALYIHSSSESYIVASSSKTFFQGNGTSRQDANLRDTWTYRQKSYERALRHEANHAYYGMTRPFAGPEFEMDIWLIEGLAKHSEWGRLGFNKTYVVGELSRSNPLLYAGPVNTGGLDYDMSSAIVEYLLSPNGANNSLTAFKALSDDLGRRAQAYRSQCYFLPLPSGCEPVSSLGNKAFVAAFEANIKEKDGTPMKLYTGTNNLRDTLVQRMQAFW